MFSKGMFTANLALIILYLGMGLSLRCSSPPPEKLDKKQPRFVKVALDVDSECREVKVYLVTYASQTDRADFCTMALSAFANGFELNVLGKKREGQWAIYGYLDKFWALREFVSLLSDEPHAIIVFVDAYDVLITAGPHSLAKRFLKSGKRILISAEKGCCSDWLTTVEGSLKGTPVLCDTSWPVPDVGTAMPYMNSGAFVGFQARRAAQSCGALRRVRARGACRRQGFRAPDPPAKSPAPARRGARLRAARSYRPPSIAAADACV
jgi:hypothetical protein